MDKFELPVIQEQSGCGCGAATAGSENTVPDLNQSFVSGSIDTPAGGLPQISSALARQDRWGSIKTRWGAGRMNYKVDPGLYALGTPDNNSSVFVSANYKLSFDRLRSALTGRSAWVLVLDTGGINVWCAAGKGTFGTDELVKRIRETSLQTVIDHNRIIVPQLGAPGVNARAVQKMTGFRVHFGPVYARDIPAYLRAGYRKSDAMRSVKFPLWDRLVLTPMEIIPAMKNYPLFALAVLLLFGLGPSGVIFSKAWSGGMPFLFLGVISVLSGALITPVMLPFIPFRSFAIKGWITGALSVIIAGHLLRSYFIHAWVLFAGACLFFPAASSYIALQFTGSTTFTGMSGVKKELRIAVPFYMGSAFVSLMLLLLYKLYEWGVV